jgi:hypothetical protein
MEIFINFNYIILLIILAAAGWLAFLIYFGRIKKYAPEAPIFARCRRKNYPIIEMIDGNRVSWFAGEPIKKGSIMTKIGEFGIGIDQKILGGDPALVARGGVPVYHYAPNLVFDITPNHARGCLAIVDYVRDRVDDEGNRIYADLDILSDPDIIALVGTDRGDLERDCMAYIDKKDSRLSLDRIVNLIMNIQDETAAVPIKKGFFAYQWAIRLNPSRFTPQNFEAIINLMRAEAAEHFKTRFDDYVKIGVGGMLLLIGLGYAAKQMGIA